MVDNDLINDDICDIYSKKICDNCGKCLEIDGVDIRAINIEDIAKNVEENQFLEDELKEAKEMLKEQSSKEEYYTKAEKSTKEKSENLDLEEEYKDAFDNIVYFDEIGIDDDLNLEELTEELYPGIRKLKH